MSLIISKIPATTSLFIYNKQAKSKGRGVPFASPFASLWGFAGKFCRFIYPELRKLQVLDILFKVVMILKASIIPLTRDKIYCML